MSLSRPGGGAGHLPLRLTAVLLVAWNSASLANETDEKEKPDGAAIVVQVVDADGRPVEGASVGVLAGPEHHKAESTDDAGRTTVPVPADSVLRAVYAWKPKLGLDYRAFYDPRRQQTGQPQEEPDLSSPLRLELTGARALRVNVLDAETREPIAGMSLYPWLVSKPDQPAELNLSDFVDEVTAVTNEEGTALFDWLPAWDSKDVLTIWPRTQEYERQRGTYSYETGDGTLTMALSRLVPIRGQVRLPDGAPAARITIQASGAGYSFDGFRHSTSTNEEGRYELLAAPDQIYLITASGRELAAEPQTGFAVRRGEPIEDLDFELRPATRIFGRVTVGSDQEPVKGQFIHVYQYGADLRAAGIELPNPDDSRRWVQPVIVHNTRTDDDGRYELFIGPGSFDIRGPRQAEVPKFEVTQEREREFDFHASRPERGPLTGLVVTGDPPQPVPGARIQGIYRHPRAGRDLEATADADGAFQVLRELYRTAIRARSEDGSLAGFVEIGPDDERVTIPIQPTATATGRAVDETTREPLGNEELVYGVNVHIGDDDNAPFRKAFGGTVTTDAEGRFQLKNLVPGLTYQITVITDRDREGHARSWRQIGSVQPESAGEPIELGDVYRRPTQPPYKPPTLAEQIASAFKSEQTVAERYRTNLRDTQLGHMKLLLVFADPESPVTREFFKLRFEDADLREPLLDYRLLPLSVTGGQADDVRALAGSLDVALPEPEGVRLVVVSPDGGPHVRLDRTADDSSDEWKTRFLDLLAAQAPLRLDARQLLAETLARAKRENKRVFLQETATWCGPCWRLSRFIDEHRETFEKDFIHLKLDHRWQHCRDVVKELRPDDKPRGIPWSVILDAQGTVLITSDGPDGNIGFPGSPQGKEHFLKMLSETAIRLDEEELQTLRHGLK